MTAIAKHDKDNTRFGMSKKNICPWMGKLLLSAGLFSIVWGCGVQYEIRTTTVRYSAGMKAELIRSNDFYNGCIGVISEYVNNHGVRVDSKDQLFTIYYLDNVECRGTKINKRLRAKEYELRIIE